MKKPRIIFSVIIAISLMAWVLPSVSAESNGGLGDTEDITIALEASPHQISQIDEYSVIEMQGFGSILNPGELELPSSGSRTIYVDDDFTDDPGNHKWDTIEEGLNDASDGDIIVVYDGTYQEHVTLDKSVTLETAEVAIIDGGGTLSTVTIAVDGCMVKGFSITGSGSHPGVSAGIRIDSGYNTISGNTIWGNKQDGILLNGSYNAITNNLISENKGSGLYTNWRPENTIVGNTISGNEDYGIYLSGGSKILRDNVMSGNGRNFGISCHGYNNDVDTSNTVDGKPIYYLVGEQNEVIDSESNAGYVVVIDSENIVIEDLTLSNNDNGICLQGCSDSTVRNCTILGNERGLYLRDSYNNALCSNHIEDNSTGISLFNSDGNLITGNSIRSNECGIVLADAYDNVIESNEVLDNDRTAIALDFSSGNLITGNTVQGNRSGIKLCLSYDCSTEYNLVTQSEYSGVRIYGGGGHLIYGNTISDNGYYGIELLWESEDNAIHHNNLIDNAIDNADAWGQEANSWDDGAEGNYWSDYEEKYPSAEEIDSTGIWDTPYEIRGEAGARDNFPLVEPFENYEVKGDFDNDGDIDILDFVLFAIAYGSELGDDNYNAIGDFDDDGDIDILDFVNFAVVYGT